MSAKAGLLKDCEVQIINSDGDTLIAKGLNLYVKPALGEATEESMSEVTVYQEVLETTESFKTHLSNTSNPHNVTIAQIGAMPNTANYGFSLEISGRNLSLKDQHENTLTTIEMPPTTNSEVTTTSAGLMSSSDKIKLNGIEDGAEVNVQSDWNQSNTSSDDYIKNKPSIPAYLADLSGTLTVVKGGTGASTASAALINLGAQASTDNSLTTTSKTVTGAINELHSAIGTLNDSLEGTLNGN